MAEFLIFFQKQIFKSFNKQFSNYSVFIRFICDDNLSQQRREGSRQIRRCINVIAVCSFNISSELSSKFCNRMVYKMGRQIYLDWLNFNENV